LKKVTEEGLWLVSGAQRLSVTVTYSLKPDVLEFLTLSRTLVAWADDHAELIAHAQAYSRRNGDETSTLTGTSELDESGPAAENDE
jgi:hypothetical protein